MAQKQLNFNIEDVCGTLSENKDGWRKELTYISVGISAPRSLICVHGNRNIKP